MMVWKICLLSNMVILGVSIINHPKKTEGPGTWNLHFSTCLKIIWTKPQSLGFKILVKTGSPRFKGRPQPLQRFSPCIKPQVTNLWEKSHFSTMCGRKNKSLTVRNNPQSLKTLSKKVGSSCGSFQIHPILLSVSLVSCWWKRTGRLTIQKKAPIEITRKKRSKRLSVCPEWHSDRQKVISHLLLSCDRSWWSAICLVGGYQIGFYSLNHQHKPLGNHALNRLSQDIIQIWQQTEIIPNGSFASCLSYAKFLVQVIHSVKWILSISNLEQVPYLNIEQF